MLRFIVRRLAISILMLIAVSVLIFVVLRLLPGDPVLTRLGATPGISQETVDSLRTEAGLDEPILAQYWSWITGVFRGDLGDSYFNQFSVTTLIAQRLPATLELTLVAMTLTVIIALPAAMIAVRRPGRLVDKIITSLATAGMAAPQFLIGVLLLVIFGQTLGWFPTRGFTSFTDDPWMNITQMVLPALTLAIAAAPLLLRYLRASLLDALDSSYIRTARGKGVPHEKVHWRHALPNALIPALTMLGMIVGYTLGGVVIIEYVFGLPGLGSLAVNAVGKRDYAILQSVVLLISAMFILTTLLVDIAVAMLDPRLRVRSARV